MKRLTSRSLDVVLLGSLFALITSCGGSVGGGAGTGGASACSNSGTCPPGTVCDNGYCIAQNVGGTGGFWGSGGTGASGAAGSFGTGGAGGGGGFGGTAGTPDPVAPGAQPPPPQPGPTAAGTGSTVIAVRQLLLGDTDAAGNPDPNLWRQLGYNLDGLISTKNGSNHCKPQPGASPSSVKTDGDNGIDNSFGSNILPLLASLSSNPSQVVDAAIASGSFTLMFRLDQLQDPALAPNQNALSAGYYRGAKFDALVSCAATPSAANCSPPKFDGTDLWPIAFESVNAGNAADPLVKFPASYVSSGTWVSGTKVNISIPLSIQGYILNLPITLATLSMKLQGANDSAYATNGVIAGVLPTDALIAEFKKVAGSFDASLCSGATFDSIAQQIRSASDIMQDGTNGDPTLLCDAISIGLGFSGRAVKLGAVAPPVPPPVDPCVN